MTAQAKNDGRANFGDIMQASSDDIPVPKDLLTKLQDTEWLNGHPYHGVVLTANGALQRIMSAWYHSEIKVEVLYNQEIKEMAFWNHASVKQYDRRVQMSCGSSNVFCVATSRVIISDEKAVEAVVSAGVGIAQLYKHFSVMPQFYLTDAGAQNTPEGPQLWREYVLHGGGIECRIREDFCPDYLNLLISDASTGGYPRTLARLPSSKSVPHMGDLLRGDRCLNTLEGEIARAASPLQRALLTAAGNVTRILTSYHKIGISVSMLQSHPCRESPTRYERCVIMVCNGIAFCRARSLITLESDEMKKSVDSGECDLGGLFRNLDLLPEFELLCVELESPDDDCPGFGRRYSLQAPGIYCEIVEEFSDVTLSLPEALSHTCLPGIPVIFPDFSVKP